MSTNGGVTSRYKTYKSSALYSMIITQKLELPSLTTQWLPDVISTDDEEYTSYRLILGGYKSVLHNYLLLSSIHLPNEYCAMEESYEACNSKNVKKINIDIKIKHDGEVNRARYMPQNPHIIATRTPFKDVLSKYTLNIKYLLSPLFVSTYLLRIQLLYIFYFAVFDYTKHAGEHGANEKCNPDLRLQGHHKEGFGLSWNTNINGYLLSCSYDKTICLWDINMTPKRNCAINPKNIFKCHTAAVEDIAWSLSQKNVFGSVSNDHKIMIWDIRQNDTHKSALMAMAHKAEINCISFNQFSDYLFATGSADNTVALWDLRNIKLKLHGFNSHEKEICQIEWSPHDSAILASASADKSVRLWDIRNIEKAKSSKTYSSPEVFVHHGQGGKINEFSWNLNSLLLFCTVSEYNIIEFWQISDDTLKNK